MTETVRWSVDGGSLIAAPHVGDTVALHWDWVCEVLTAERAGRIEDPELRRLRAARLSPVAPPAPGGTPPGRRAAWRR